MEAIFLLRRSERTWELYIRKDLFLTPPPREIEKKKKKRAYIYMCIYMYIMTGYFM